jgi:AraC-like DNA-binding protein/mannose-6-phosphate isomerase-like protein (cupin superfamily)
LFAFFGESRLGGRHLGRQRSTLAMAPATALKYLLSMQVAARHAIHQNFLPPGSQGAFVWKYSEPIGGRRPRHFHAEPELNVIVRGSATFGIGESVVKVGPGELIGFPSAQDHVLLDSSPDLYLYAIGLDPDYSAHVLPNEPSLPLHVHLAGRELGPVLERAADIVDRPCADQLGAELWQRLHWLARHATPRSARTTHVLTRRTLQLLRVSPELALTALATTLRAHPTDISRHFHRDMGMTLVRYRTRLKLFRFIQSVDADATELMSAAAAAGFGSYSQCHRVFQAELGCSPRQFFVSGFRERMQCAYSDESQPVVFQ